MSVEVIELIIKEAMRDGEISAAEKVAILKQAEALGVDSNLVVAMIDAELEKIQKSKSEREKKVLEAEEKRRNVANLTRFNKNYAEWSDDLDDGHAFWAIIYSIAGLITGILNAYFAHKKWYAYILMALLCAAYGLITWGIVYGISVLTKRKPILDWHRPVQIAFGILLFIFLLYMLIPF